MIEQETNPVALLLQRGQSWEEDGKTFQAIGTYFRLMEYHPGTQEARRARGHLFDLAQRFEVQGKVHQATHLFERLAAL